MKKSPLAPRNPLVVPALQRKAGAHGRSRKAQRRAERSELQSKLDRYMSERNEDGGFSGKTHPAVRLAGRIASLRRAASLSTFA